VAFAAALPPDGGEAGSWNAAVLAALAANADLEVHAFADRPLGSDIEHAAFADRRSSGTGGVPRERRIDGTSGAGRPRRTLAGPTGVPARPLAALEAFEGLEGRFDAVIYVVADDGDHTGSLAALRRRRDGIVVAHSATLSELYGHAARSGGLADGLEGTIRSAYGDSVHPGVGAHDTLPRTEARRLGIVLARDVLAHCHRLLLTTGTDAAVADLDAAPADRAKVQLAGGEPDAVALALYGLVSAAGG
jgi:hypothetical protein